MTIQESTICNLVQTFPILLILAQNHNKCLKTPLVYKPPSPTPSTEYYEALEALFHSLYGHGSHGEDHGYNGCHSYYGKKLSVGQQPCYSYAYPSPGFSGHEFTSHGYGYPAIHGYSATPNYGYKKVSVYNLTGTHGYRAYAPTQVYNMNHKYKVIVKRNKTKIPRRKPQKLQMEPCEVDGYRGSCIPILSCEPYVKMLQQSKSNPAVAQLLRKAHCGFEGSYPKVCCPIPGIPDQPPPRPDPTPSPTPAPIPTMAPQQEPKSGDQTDASDYASIPDPPECGTSNATLGRVVGGVNASLGDFPWMALLGYKKARGNTDWLCGGSLITSKHVLTAAHCVHGHEKSLYVVRLGELDLAREDEGASPVDVLIKKQIKHEEYDSNSFSNDIALLLLARVVSFSHLIKPICLPRSNELRANTFEDYSPIVAGWGSLEFRGPSAQILQALQLPVVSNEFCQNAYKAYPKQIIDDRVLCAGYKKGGKDACQGDSGGPLMQPIWNSQTYKTYICQIGVVSFGKKCAEPGFPGVYSRVTTFIPWLEEKIIGPA